MTYGGSAGECPVCGGPARELFRKCGAFSKKEYEFRKCGSCGFMHISNPDTDYASIYDERYYRGLGADPKVAFLDELLDPDETVRAYEWRGILKRVTDIVGPATVREGRWLDYGCGNGCLVRYLRREGVNAVGCDDGWITAKARTLDIPVVSLSEIREAGGFDIVTAIEVLEHLVDPVAVLRDVRSLVKPGGLLFVTTGNLSPWESDPARWGYIVPEVHVSYFTPAALSVALRRSGFEPFPARYGPGWTDIVRFKLLKNLGIRKRGTLEAMAPWPLLSRLANARYRWTDHPVAWAAGEERP